MNSLRELTLDVFSRFTKKKSPKSSSPKSSSLKSSSLKKSYRTTPLNQDEYETIFDPSSFDININGNIYIKSKTSSNEDTKDCLTLRERSSMIHIVKLDKCTEGGKNLLNKLINLSEKYQKKLTIDVDISQITFEFGEKDFKEHGTVKLNFIYILSDLYLQCYGMTWYNSLGFVDKNFDKNHAFFVEKYGEHFEENKKDEKRMRTILNKGSDMTYEEYLFLKSLEDKFNVSSKSHGDHDDELDEKYDKITHNLIYDSNRVYKKGGRKTKRKTIKRKNRK